MLHQVHFDSLSFKNANKMCKYMPLTVQNVPTLEAHQLVPVLTDLGFVAHVNANRQPSITKLIHFHFCFNLFQVSIGCGGKSSQNCTYFQVTAASAGTCGATICKCSGDICQVKFWLNCY